MANGYGLTFFSRFDEVYNHAKKNEANTQPPWQAWAIKDLLNGKNTVFLRDSGYSQAAKISPSCPLGWLGFGSSYAITELAKYRGSSPRAIHSRLCPSFQVHQESRRNPTCARQNQKIYTSFNEDLLMFHREWQIEINDRGAKKQVSPGRF